MAGPGHGCDDSLEQVCTQRIKNGRNIELQEKWVNPDPDLQRETMAMFPEACQNHRVFSPRSGKRPKTTVFIRSIRGTPYEHLQDTENLSIYAGGPGSMVGAALDSVISFSNPPPREKRKCRKVMYATYDFEHSNARSSAYYFHVRHSNALNADPLVRGHRILYQFLKRQLISREQLIVEAQNLSYLKVDLSLSSILSDPTHCLRTLRILSGGLWHTVKNVVVENVNPMHTDWVRNRSYSQYSVGILRYLESAASELGVQSGSGKKPSLLVGTESDTATPEAIHVVFDEEGAEHTEKDNALVFKTNQIKSRELSETELTQVMGGDKGQIYKAYVYPGDGRIPADMNLVLRDIVEKSGNSWREGVAIDSVFVDNKGVRGVEFRNIVTGERWYQPCSSIVLSLGYTSCYKFEAPQQGSPNLSGQARYMVSSLKRKLGFQSPVPNTITAAGCSGYFLVKGRIPIVGAQNSHWTEVAYDPDKDITLAKLTGGGNIGSEHIPATYVLNNLEHLRKLFGERVISVLSIDSCPRAVNPQNDVQFYRIVPRFVISLGLGGTGMTKSGANGALSYLLSHPGAKASELIPGEPKLFSSVNLQNFVTERTSFAQRALNLRADYSALEIASVVGAGLGVIFTAAKLHVTRRSSTPHTHSSTHTRINISSRFQFFRTSTSFLSSQTAAAHRSSLVRSSSSFPHHPRPIHTAHLINSSCYLEKCIGCNLRLLALYRNLRRIRL